MGQRGDRARVAMGKHQKFVNIDAQTPMPGPITVQQPVQPINTEFRALVTAGGCPKRHIILCFEIFAGAVNGSIFDKNEPGHTHPPVIPQEIR